MSPLQSNFENQLSFVEESRFFPLQTEKKKRAKTRAVWSSITQLFPTFFSKNGSVLENGSLFRGRAFFRQT